MNNNPFFFDKNTINKLSEKELKQTYNYLATIEAFSRVTYSSVYVIDYQKKGFDFVSHNPLFLCGHSPEEVQEMGYAFYFKYVPEEDLELLLKINTTGFEFFHKIPVDERLLYTLSYDFHLRNNEGKTVLVNQKITPIYLTDEGKIWKAICVVSISEKKNSGNITLYKKGRNIKLVYNIEGDYWKEEERLKLSEREKEILIYSARGFSIAQIAEAIFVSADTVKFHRKKMFEKLGVSNISEAIFFATNNQLI
ncbi:response regulator transcription factor [Ornithobacterium rhinotracheale]|uniref:Response regulator containing a CheY-like receiver domain and an HTH DNA-binding domain n=1 Tax=Ornithobacterium rhinotracheale (strain ATCC 51463 / DSM 15997 / CCUG 23171 / CIP 104009 / LMG 9086) TaxID=867902 RepID=I4A2C3_ORNRL|nr:helix-turn-helix transcriptional regulator [Ornithobacterium rhinotracheale]AFL98107.1 response regulator containing a CheY-like receiver domain and an HTH DNA-binding domain [Ornithobacterium rhinotracheale DSM 15997]AIP99872.1 LuxR family transcriptional regulator [Ornithobacterium rhinotracheale ORT-UMN 88]KGB66053.1 LuxR family transcriptional regulator [Ornithobacterium rhinotracheale H06-030791]MCK0199177.1 helix-turn-helix transcriptional regulator [Ornithobacterium rhinotracheale]MC